MVNTIIRNATIVNEGKSFVGDLWIKDNRIERIGNIPDLQSEVEEIDATGLHLLPGCIDDQVHFREPGLTHKGTIHSESRAAVAGGITSFMEMPNTNPPAVTQQLLAEKYAIGALNSMANYSFFMGTSNTNLDELLRTDPSNVCGVKIFMGSSTGDMLVDDHNALEQIFSNINLLIATHCEVEGIVKRNYAEARERFGDNIPVAQHPIIRSREACYESSSFAISLAKKHNTRLHILHISTAEETALFGNTLPLAQKRITAEACVHHLWFSDEDYAEKGFLIKWNPAIKTSTDRAAIRTAIVDDRIDIIATDHAPHTIEEKSNLYPTCPSGGPLVQHALVAMLEQVKVGWISLEKVVEKMAHAPAICFQVANRGFIREGYFADLVWVDLNKSWLATRNNNFYKCGWSPFEGTTFSSTVKSTFVNGTKVYHNGSFNESYRGERLLFNR
jgi:dihydroorotase